MRISPSNRSRRCSHAFNPAARLSSRRLRTRRTIAVRASLRNGYVLVIDGRVVQISGSRSLQCRSLANTVGTPPVTAMEVFESFHGYFVSKHRPEE